jgi:GDP-4-dehydro-6-deoxy-D-mannose reductase
MAAPAVRRRARRARAPAEPAAARTGQRRGGGVQRPRLGRAPGRERPALSLRVVITGHTGFAGAHLAAACREVTGLSRSTGCDLLDAGATRAAIAAARPDVVYHLAALAHVGESWRDPERTLRDNVAMTLHVLEAVRAEAPGAVVVVVSSGEVYGPPAVLPVDETAPLAPRNPYAVSKASGDLLAGMYTDLHVIRARAFNHAGPGQDASYAISSFARQAAAGATRIVTGNPRTRRDYTDVRDVVRAYRLLAERAEPGVYNVCSGRSVSTEELVRMLGAEVEVEPALLRPNEVMDLYGAGEKLRAATGWEPEIPLERTLRDARESWRRRAGPAPARTAAPRPARGRSPRS